MPASLERFRAYFEATSSGIFVYGADGRLIDINPAACRMHGRSREEMLAMDPREFIAPESHAVFDAFQRALSSGERFSGEARGLRRDGSRFDAEVEGQLIEVEGERYMFSSLIDVTERKALAAQLLHAQRLEAVGQLAGGVAHDFNNLLSVILGYATLLEDALEDPEQREEAAAIVAACDRAGRLVHRLLAFSRRQKLAVEDVHLNAFLARQVSTLSRLLPENVAFSFTPAPGDPVVCVDPGQLEQIVLNLANNARQAMPAGGRLDLEASEVDLHDSLEVRPGRYARLVVRDTGSGIAPAHLDRIFQPFFTTKPRGEGTGLGLSMVYGSVKQHGGQIAVASELGVGTTFTIDLPLATEPTPPGAEPRRQPLQRGQERVLVVEDNDAVRELTARVLRVLGYHVRTAANGAEADASVAEEPVDLLLTDVILPEGNGREVYERLRARLPDLKVLFMSGYARDVVSRSGVLGPGVPALSKPFRPEELAAAVRRALDG